MMWLLILGWIACGVTQYGYYVAYFQGRFPALAEEDYVKDRVVAGVLGLGGPIALIPALFLCQGYGWKL